eukprot:jgi/Bigna1/91031/estExt_fgenesh1_pg.C_860041
MENRGPCSETARRSFARASILVTTPDERLRQRRICDAGKKCGAHIREGGDSGCVETLSMHPIGRRLPTGPRKSATSQIQSCDNENGKPVFYIRRLRRKSGGSFTSFKHYSFSTGEHRAPPTLQLNFLPTPCPRSAAMAFNLQALIAKRTKIEHRRYSECKQNSLGKMDEQVSQLSEAFGVKFEDLKGFLLNAKMKEAVSQTLKLPSSEYLCGFDMKGHLNCDFDIKSNGLDAKHSSMLDDSKERVGGGNSVMWDSKIHRQLRYPGYVEGFNLNLDNKHGKSDKKGFSFDSSEGSSTGSSATYLGDIGSIGSICDSPRVHATVPSMTLARSSSGDTMGGLTGDVFKLPNDPDFTFFSDGDDDEGEDTATDTAHSSISILSRISERCPDVDKKIEMSPKRESKNRKAKLYVDGCESVLQLDANRSILSQEVLMRMKMSFYRQSLAGGWKKKRVRDEASKDVKMDTTQQQRLKRIRIKKESSDEDLSVQQFSEEFLRSFANRIVSCPLCRVPSNIGHEGNVRF